MGILTIANRGSIASDEVGAALTEQLRAVGHRCVDRDLVADDPATVRRHVTAWVDDPEIDVVIAVGGQHPVTASLTSAKPIAGFEDLARWAVSDESSLAAIHVRAEAAQVGPKLVFAIGGPPGAIRAVVERILIPQIDVRSHAANLVALLPAPRSRRATLEQPAPRPTTDKIMQIGNLPSAASAVALGKVPRQVPSALSLLGMVCAGAAAAVAFLFLHGPAPEAPAIAIDDQEPVFMATNDAIFTAPHGKVATTRPAASTRPVVQKHATVVGAAAKETPAKETPAKETPADEPSYEPCGEQSCAASNYERECCAPYKNATPELALGLDRVMIAGALASVHPVVEQCAMQDVHGTVKVHMQVTPQGTVVDSEPRDTPDPDLGECVASAVKKAQFPHTQRGGTFTSSFAF